MKLSFYSAVTFVMISLAAPTQAAIFTFEFEADGSLPNDNVFGTVSGRIVGISESDPFADAISWTLFQMNFHSS